MGDLKRRGMVPSTCPGENYLSVFTLLLKMLKRKETSASCKENP
jgi:hypothetical protein